MERISSYQLAVTIILFEIGSTPLFALGSGAKQDSWLAMLFAAAAGLLLLFMFLYIQRIAPEECLIGLLKLCFGNKIGTVIGGCFALYFAYESMRNLRDFGEITNLTLLSSTPQYVTMLIIALLATYAVAMGIETFSRVNEALLPLISLSYGALILLILISGILHKDNLLPILDNGLRPVIKAAFPDILSFPFGQMVLFFMIWHLMSEKQKIKRISILSYLSVAAFLILMNILNLMVLGTTIVANSTLPFLQAVQLIQVGDILERLDVMVTLLLFLGLFVKMTAFYWGAVYACTQLSRSTSRRLWVFYVGFIIFITSFIEPNYTYHVWLGLNVSVKFFPVFQVVIPLLMFLAVLFRKHRRAETRSNV
ncbi:GerAB/ArcD/ProY family transporter [Paenibacillus sp. Soil724D2]|uniref:GerAB/ArcD/ProY family transporter n=1 Tax=Paenibacillus sp. (strain Soil724D2) TaxID=1736392 RepID=UPI00071389A0|nr:endospore germination permease [Paenibacillus sp. Soil724D2]KRE40357.1 spore gernimation protein [Paenibacillus sp. Soil724D2]